LQARGLGT